MPDRLGEDLVEAASAVVERLAAGLEPDRGRRSPPPAARSISSSAFSAARPGERHLERHPRVEQLVHRDALGREHHRDRLAEVAAHALAGRARDEDPAGAAAADADQVRGGQQPQRLAQRRAADAELVGELLLGADPVAGLQLLALEVAPDLERRSARSRPSAVARTGALGGVAMPRWYGMRTPDQANSQMICSKLAP